MCGYFFADVVQEIEVPLERQFRMMPALHQDLDSACSSEFVELLIKLLEAQHVMIVVALRSDKTRRTCSKHCRRSCN